MEARKVDCSYRYVEVSVILKHFNHCYHKNAAVLIILMQSENTPIYIATYEIKNSSFSSFYAYIMGYYVLLCACIYVCSMYSYACMYVSMHLCVCSYVLL